MYSQPLQDHLGSDIKGTRNSVMYYLVSIMLLVIFVNTTAYADTKEQWLQAHNIYRCMHGVPAFLWSEDYAKLAEKTANLQYTKDCNNGCGHCNPDTTGINAKAENLTCYSSTPQNAVESWYSEEENFDYDNPTYVSSEAGGQKVNGHFINIVAKGLTKVGCFCASKSCDCVYEGYYGTSTEALKQDVPRPTKTKEQCQ